MARISITTDDGQVVDIITDAEIGDLERPMASASLLNNLLYNVKRARLLDEENRARVEAFKKLKKLKKGE